VQSQIQQAVQSHAVSQTVRKNVLIHIVLSEVAVLLLFLIPPVWRSQAHRFANLRTKTVPQTVFLSCGLCLTAPHPPPLCWPRTSANQLLAIAPVATHFASWEPDP